MESCGISEGNTLPISLEIDGVRERVQRNRFFLEIVRKIDFKVIGRNVGIDDIKIDQNRAVDSVIIILI